MWRTLRCWASYTLEASFFGASNGKLKGLHFNLGDYLNVGRAFCLAVADMVDSNKKVCVLAVRSTVQCLISYFPLPHPGCPLPVRESARML